MSNESIIYLVDECSRATGKPEQRAETVGAR
jgi:hypothetical protein